MDVVIRYVHRTRTILHLRHQRGGSALDTGTAFGNSFLEVTTFLSSSPSSLSLSLSLPDAKEARRGATYSIMNLNRCNGLSQDEIEGDITDIAMLYVHIIIPDNSVRTRGCTGAGRRTTFFILTEVSLRSFEDDVHKW